MTTSGALWYTADLHLAHKLCAGLRGFGEDTEAHDAHLAQRWEEKVAPNDRIWVLGDLCIGRGWAHTYALEWLAARPGIKHLLWGNHDSGHPMHAKAHKSQRQYLEVFASAQMAAMHKIAGQRVMLSHFPFSADHQETVRYPEWRPVNAGQWLLHGHTHSDVKVRGKEIHVGVDAHDLAPVPRSWVEKTITEEERRTANPAPRVPMLQRGDKLGTEHTAMLAAVGFQGSASEIGEGGRQGYLYTYDSNPEVDDRVLEITTDRSNIIQSIRISGTPTATVTLTPL